MNVETRSIYANPRLVDDPTPVAAALSPLLGLPAAEVEGKLRRDKSFVYLARDLDPAAARKVLALKLPGVGAESSVSFPR